MHTDDDREQSLPDFNYSSIEEKLSSLNRNDSGYYEAPRRLRQRIPPKNIYPSSASEASLEEDDEVVLDLYKSDCRPRKAQRSGEGDFSIPRPKLIVPVHSYGVRKRRTGNLLQRGAECGEGAAEGEVARGP